MVFDETLELPPAGFEFGLPLSLSRIGTVGGTPPGQLAKGPLLVQTAPQFTDYDIFLDISKGTIVLKGCSSSPFTCGSPPVSCNQGCGSAGCSLLDFEPIPNISPKQQSFHSFDDAADCGNPSYSIDGYASLKVDLSMAPFFGNIITLISLFGYSFQARVPIAAPPTGTMNLIIWGPGGVGSDWLNGAGSLFAASVLPSANETLTSHTFTPNVDLTNLLAFFVETASHAVESYPDNQDAYNAPVTLRLRVSEQLSVIVQSDSGIIAGATVNIRDSTGAIVASGTTDGFGVFTVMLAPANYTAQSVLGSLSQTSPLLSPTSQTVRFTWPHPIPSATYTVNPFSAIVTLDGSASKDPAAGTITSDTFLWVFGDGTSQSGVGLSIVSHSYAPGTYNVQLTQTSLDGLSATFSFSIFVSFGAFGGGLPRRA